MITQRTSPSPFEAIQERMAASNINPDVIKEFQRRVQRVREGFSGKIPWNEIEDPRPEDLVEMESLPESRNVADDLSRLVVIKLNGGLGTSMGLSQAKSLIKIKNNESFLFFMKKQIEWLRKKYGVQLPLLFMNSFNTQEDTLKEPGIREINRSDGLHLPPDFLQNMVPRIHAGTLEPVGDGGNKDSWCPPGHGDIYLAMHTSGILDNLIEQGYEVAFISNSDNLSATVEPNILSHFLNSKLDFAMEITPKTLADIKGGVIIRHNDGNFNQIELLEAAQVEDDHLDDFKNIKRFKYFNTNNLWINLKSLKDKMESGGGLPLSVIVNPKNVDGVDVLQLETAMGAAIGHFSRVQGIIIPRSRFAPVKSCADLLVRRSDAYEVQEDFSIRSVMNAEPVIELDRYYKNVDDFESYFPKIPSLKNTVRFELKGPVQFDVPVEITGKVKIINNSGSIVKIGKLGKSRLENEEVIF